MEKHYKLLKTVCSENGGKIIEFELKKENFPKKIIYLEIPKSKKTIIFVHGFGCDKLYPLIELFLELLKKKYSLILFNLPGHGRKGKETFSVKQSIDYLSNVIKYSKKELKIKKENLILAGYSLGGFLTLLESEKKSVSGIITISALHKIDLSTFVFLELFSIFSRDSLKQMKHYSFKFFFPSFGIFRKKVYPVRSSSKNKIKEIAKEISSYTLLDKIKKSEIPYLQIHGKMDLFVPFSQAKEIKESYGGKNKEQFFPLFQNHLTIGFKKTTRERILNWLDRLP